MSGQSDGSAGSSLWSTIGDVAGKIWSIPNTGIGLVVGGIASVASELMGNSPYITIDNNAIQFITGLPISAGGGLTLGNVQIYSGQNTASDGTVSYVGPNSPAQPYDGGPANFNLGPHEEGHTYQAQWLGPFYIPVYLLLGGISNTNLMELSADGYARGSGSPFSSF